MFRAHTLLLAANPFRQDANSIGIPKSTANIGAALTNVTNILMSIIGMLAIIFIIVGGLQMALAAGNSKRFAQGRETVLYASVGLAIAIAAFAIVKFISGAPLGRT
jgi:hypothetical protein